MPTPSFVTSATSSNVLNNPASTTESGNAMGPTAFLYTTGDSTGNDVLTFNKYDTLLTTEALYDRNGNGNIRFVARDGVLASDRTGIATFNQGDTIQFTTIYSGSGLRFLGTRDGYSAYGDYKVKSALLPQGNVIEGTVNSETLTGTASKDVFLYDTATGLNLGGDTVRQMGANDELVLTSKFFDSDNDGQIRYGKNKLFHLPDSAGNVIGGTSADLGGTLAIFDDNGARVNAIYLTSTDEINGVTYYHYQTHAAVPSL